MHSTRTAFAAFMALVCAMLVNTAHAQVISLPSLLEEMIDRATVARVPAPWYRCAQFSSYDRRSTTPDDPDGWFANSDASQYLRKELNNGRTEWVMMDAEGPGAVVRIWSANPKGTLRVYLDDELEPVIEASMESLLGGTWSPEGVDIAEPLAATRSRGWNLYLPIPYAGHCKITNDQDGFYYQVNYRIYERDTVIEPFTMEALSDAASTIAHVQQALTSPYVEADSNADTVSGAGTLNAGDTLVLDLPRGPAAVRALTCTFAADDMADALRSLVITATFDGGQTIWCPAGDFFGSGIGLNEFEDWYRTVTHDGNRVQSRWIMPYAQAGAIQFENLGSEPVTVDATASMRGWEWNDASLHFHTRWRQQDPIATRPMQDWNYIEIAGTGVFVGDTLAVANPVEQWWGEGDEKIYVDGETFPSHFGTGTEDYYGYAWCCPEPFTGPFHAQPRCDGPGNYGHTTVSRVRMLDAIPFDESFIMDMEVWHWAECEVGYAATTHFYAGPEVLTNRLPMPDEAARGAINPPPLPPPFTIEGAIECETLDVIAASEGVSVGEQAMKGFAQNTWSHDAHLWVQGKEPGAFVTLRIPCENDDPVSVILYATRSWDYGIIECTINGEPAGDGPIDMFSGQHGRCVSTGPIELGTFRPKNGELHLRVEVTGGNANSLGTRSFFGLDCVLLQPAG